jgi:hypothetical protein
MTERSAKQTFPRRDADGRVISLREFLIAVVVGVLLSLAALAVVETVFALLNLGDFGGASGWLTAILPIFLFVDDFRGWKRAGGAKRLIVAVVGLALGLATGLVAASLASALPNIVSGTIGAFVFCVAYTVIWYTWIRWLTGQHTSGDTS